MTHERDPLARLLRKDPTPEPPAGLLEELRRQIPAEIEPPRLDPSARNVVPFRGPIPPRLWLAAASVALLVGGGSLGWLVFERYARTAAPGSAASVVAPEGRAAKAAAPVAGAPAADGQAAREQAATQPQAAPEPGEARGETAPPSIFPPPPPASGRAAPPAAVLAQRDAAVANEAEGGVEGGVAGGVAGGVVGGAPAAPPAVEAAKPEPRPAEEAAASALADERAEETGAPAKSAARAVQAAPPAEPKAQAPAPTRPAAPRVAGAPATQAAPSAAPAQPVEVPSAASADEAPSPPALPLRPDVATNAPPGGSPALAAIQRALADGTLPAPATVDVPGLVAGLDYGDRAPAGAPALRVEATRAPWGDAGMVAARFAVAAPAGAQVAASVEVDGTGVATWRDAAGSARVVRGAGAEPLDLRGLAAGRAAVVLLELEPRAGLPPAATLATLRVRWRPSAAASWREERRVLRAGDVLAGWDAAPRGLRLALVAARLGEALRGDLASAAGEDPLVTVARRAGELVDAFPDDPQVRALARSAARARELRSRGAAHD